MNELLKTFFTPRQIEYEYISLDAEGIIIEFSANVGRLSDCAEAVIPGNEISLSFPEIIGLESIFNQLIAGRISYFELKGISRDIDADSSVYFDIYIFKNEKETYLDGEILVLLDDTTKWMVREQKYTQVYREYELSVSRLEQANHYINKIIHSMNDMLLITNSSGIITRLNKATQDLLEYREDELLHESITKIFLDKFSGSSFKLLDFLSGSSHSEQLEVECKTKNKREITVSFSCSRLTNNTLDSQEFLWIGRDVTQKKKLELRLYQQLEQNRLLIEMTQHIRQSLSLENIIQTTVIEVRKLLKVEGVLCYHFSDEKNGYILAHSFESNLIRQFQAVSQDILIPNHFIPVLEQGIITRVDDFNRSHLAISLRNFWSKFDINSELIIPIIPQDSPTQSASRNNLWGVLIAYQFHQNRRWEEWEILLLEQLTTPIAVAIQQAELYEKQQIGNQELKKMTITDHLTLVINRNFFDEVLSKEWYRMQRESDPLSLILCDLDYFKRYNDTYGRLAGDACLQEIAQTLQKVGRRSGDLVARYDGEKFAILLPKTDLKGAVFVSEQICSRVRSLQIPNDNSEIGSYLTISVGVSSIIPEVPLVPKTLILRAEQALHEAKINGGDRVFSAAN